MVTRQVTFTRRGQAPAAHLYSQMYLTTMWLVAPATLYRVTIEARQRKAEARFSQRRSGSASRSTSAKGFQNALTNGTVSFRDAIFNL